MTRERTFALSRPWVPDLHHAVLATADEPQMVGRKSPDAFYMPEESPHARLSARCMRVGERVSRKHPERGRWCRSCRSIGFGSGNGRVWVEVYVPKSDGRVESAGEHIPRWRRPVGVTRPEGLLRRWRVALHVNVIRRASRRDTVTIVVLLVRCTA